MRSRTHAPGNQETKSIRCLESLIFMSTHTRNRSFHCSWVVQFIKKMHPKASEMKPWRCILAAKSTQVRVWKTMPKTVTRKMRKCVQKVSTNTVLQSHRFVTFWCMGPKGSQGRPKDPSRRSPRLLLFKNVYRMWPKVYNLLMLK